MPRLSVYRGFLVSLAFTFTLIVAERGQVLAEAPSKAKPAESGTFVKHLGELCHYFGDCGRDWGEFWEELNEVPKPPTNPNRSMLIRVVDPDGKPVVKAKVTPIRIVHNSADTIEEWIISRELGWSRTITGPDGTVRIARPTTNSNGIQVNIKAKGYVLSSTAWNAHGKILKSIPSEYTFNLQRSRAVGGTVRDPSGRPIPGARVVLSLTNNDPDDSLRHNFNQHKEWANLRGQWRCDHLPSRLDGLTISVSHYKHVDLDLDEANLTSQLADLHAMKAVFTMQPGLVVKGKIIDADGKPVASARVMLSPCGLPLSKPFPTRAEVTSGCDGSYRFVNCLPGGNRIVVSAHDLTTQHRDITIKPGMTAVDFRLSPGLRVKIRVVDAAGKPLVGAQVLPDFPLFSNQSVILDDIETDQDGHWESASSPDGKIPLAISKPGYATVHPLLAAGEKEHLITMRSPVRISGRVVDAVTKKPLRKICISSHYTESEREPNVLVHPTVTVDGEGGYKLTFSDVQGVDVVTWRIRVQAAGYVMQVSPQFEVREGSRTLDFQLVPGKAVSGVVKRPDGSPAAFARVLVATASEPCSVFNGHTLEGVFTGADGRFHLPRPLEPYIVGVVHPFGGAEIAAKSLDEQGEIILHPWGRVEGVIRGSHNPDSKKVSVSLNVECIESTGTDKQDKRPFIDWSYSTDTARSGRFSFSRVLPGKIEVSPFDGSIYIIEGIVFVIFREQTIEVAPGGTTSVEFACKGLPVVGRVALPDEAARKFAATTGFGGLVFQRPLVPFPKDITDKSPQQRKAWEKQWLESEAGKMAVRGARNVTFTVEADGTFHADNVAPGVYKLLIELNEADAKPDKWGEQVAWLAQEVTVPEQGNSPDGPIDLGRFTLNMEYLFYGDAAPDFAFKTADGRTHRLSEYRGKKVMLCFSEKWAALEWITNADEMRRHYLGCSGGGPLVWINLSSDSNPPPAVDMSQDAEFQYLQGAPQRPNDVLKAYDIRHPGAYQEYNVLITGNGNVVRQE